VCLLFTSIMSFRLSHILFLVAHVTSATILTNQCWHESPFLTVDLQTSLDGSHDRALPFPNNHLPWTNQPTCTDILPSIGEPLCIYTDDTFSKGRGISIFTTPSLSAHFASLPAFQNLLSKDVNKPTGVYRTQEITGKGIGVLASQSLQFGDLVTAHTPAFIAYLESELSTLEREKIWRRAIEQLPSGLRDRFMTLSTVYGDPRVQVQDIVKANTFQLEVGGKRHLAVWPETSRLNHGCAPKCVYTHPPSNS
jgi:hypothetical protein